MMKIDPQPDEVCDVLIIGAGFYGCNLALTLKRQNPSQRILVLEQEETILGRASYANQSRVHNGYHYPRSLITAARSRVNYQRFLDLYSDCVDLSFTKIYAIARRGSQVTARQFIRFCQEIGAELRPVRASLRHYLSDYLIEDCFEVDEVAFNAIALRQRLMREMTEAGIDIRLKTKVRKLQIEPAIRVYAAGNQAMIIGAGKVFNCSYAGLNHIGALGDTNLLNALKYELTEIALIDVPDHLRRVGITVMDGPFFSTMPFPARQLHSLSHVRYTPHFNWTAAEAPACHPDEIRRRYSRPSRAALMLRDAQRYVPSLSESIIRDSLFEIKVILKRNEADDGRPILMTHHPEQQNLTAILGGKIDNVFDIISLMDRNQTHATH